MSDPPPPASQEPAAADGALQTSPAQEGGGRRRGRRVLIVVAALALLAGGLAWFLFRPPARTSGVTSSSHLLFYLLTALQNSPESEPFLGGRQFGAWQGLLARWVEEAEEEDYLLRGLVGDQERLFTPGQAAWITCHRESPRRGDVRRVVTMLEKTAGIGSGSPATQEPPLHLVGPEIGALNHDVIVANVLRMGDEAGLALTPEQARRILPVLGRWMAVRERMDALVDRMYAVLDPSQRERLEELYQADARSDDPATSSDLELARNAISHGPLSLGGPTAAPLPAQDRQHR